MTYPVGTILAWATATPPADWLACDGSSLLRADYADLFDVIATKYGSADGTHFSLPDLRQRFPVGGSDPDTGRGTAAGTIDHTHTGPSHTHAVDQPAAHSDHSPTQPTDHGAPTSHAGFAVSQHAAQSHAGFALSDHTITQADTHPQHTSGGAHTHDAATILHSTTSTPRVAASAAASFTHSSVGGHQHAVHAAHSGFALTSNVHSVTNQGDDHGTRSHPSPVQPSDHGAPTAHAGFTVDAHSAHANAATTADGTGATGTANPPFMALHYIILAAEAAPDIHGTSNLSVAAALEGTGTKGGHGASNLTAASGLAGVKEKGAHGALAIPEHTTLASTATKAAIGHAALAVASALAETAHKNGITASELDVLVALAETVSSARDGASALALLVGLAETVSSARVATSDLAVLLALTEDAHKGALRASALDVALALAEGVSGAHHGASDLGVTIATAVTATKAIPGRGNTVLTVLVTLAVAASSERFGASALAALLETGLTVHRGAVSAPSLDVALGLASVAGPTHRHRHLSTVGTVVAFASHATIWMPRTITAREAPRWGFREAGRQEAP